MLDNVSSYKDLTLLISTGEKVKAELEKSIEEIESFFRKIEGVKGYKHSTSYTDYDAIQGDRDTFASVGTIRLQKELERLQAMLDLQNANLHRYYSIKKEIDYCANEVTDVIVKVSMLRKLGITQEEVSEIVNKSVNTIQRYDKKERERT